MDHRCAKLILVLALLAASCAAQGTASRIRSATAVPASCRAGTAVVPADFLVINGVPSVCTTTGTPGVWKSLFYLDASQTLTGQLTLFTSSTSAASMLIPSGVDPTSCTSGQFWSTGSSLKICRASVAQIIETREFKNAASGYMGLDSGSRALKTNQQAATVYNDQANTFSTGAQDFGAATSLKVPVAAGAAPTTSGLIAYDPTKGSYAFGETMGASTTATTAFAPRFFTFLGASTTVTATVTETVFSTSTGLFPANFFTVGKVGLVYIEVQDVMTAAPVSRKYQLRLQKTGPVNVYLFTPGTGTPTASSTRSTGMLFLIRCVTTGTTGTVDVGMLGVGVTAASVVVNTIAQPITIDTTVDQTVQLTQTLGAATASETSQLRFMMLGELN